MKMEKASASVIKKVPGKVDFSMTKFQFTRIIAQVIAVAALGFSQISPIQAETGDVLPNISQPVPILQTQSPNMVNGAVNPTAAAPGGIDFDPTNMNLQIKRNGKGVPLSLPQQNLDQIYIPGLFPVIINIMPIHAENLPIILGQAPKEPAKEPELAANAAS